MKNHFITALIQLFKIENNPVTIQAIDKMTAHVTPDQYPEFVEKCGQSHQYKRPIEIIKHVSDEYMTEIKSELFRDVEKDAKELCAKLEALFLQVESLFYPASTADKEIIIRFETPRGYFQEAKIKAGEFWTERDVYIVGKIGLARLYHAYNDPYIVLQDEVANEIKNAITAKYLVGNKKQIANGSSNNDILQLANKKQM